MITVDRCLLVGSGMFFTAAALRLFVAPQGFYATIPGVAATGPINAHLLRDVGVSYAVLALGLSGSAHGGLPRAQFATAASAYYLGGHAALHLIMGLTSGNVETARAEAGRTQPLQNRHVGLGSLSPSI